MTVVAEQITIYEVLLNFFTYGFLGWCTEVAFAAVRERRFVNRGFLNGPLCPIYGIGVTVVIVLLKPYMNNLVVLYLMSALLVTFLEYITGALLEKLFHHRWWDYSKMPFNIKGYVCIPFSLIWGLACVVIVKCIHPFISKLLLWIPRWLGITLLVIMCGLFIADIYVTVTGILKMNRRLEKMEEIAEELHRVSDQIGENIYRNMMEGIEKQEQAKQKSVELKQKRDELKQKYEDMIGNTSRTSRRLLKAFPAMKSNEHAKQIENLRARFERKKS